MASQPGAVIPRAAVSAAAPLSLDRMREAVATALGEPPAAVGTDDDLLRLGVDSVTVMRLAAEWRASGANVTFAELTERRTLREWWELASSRLPAAVDGDGDGDGHGYGGEEVVDETAPFELATMQHAYWIGRADGQTLGGVGAHFYNEFDGRDVDPGRLEGAVRALMRRHGMLRARFLDDGRQQIMAEPLWPGLAVHDLRELPPAEAERFLADLRDRLSHHRLDVERGEVFDMQLSLLPGGECRTHVHIEMLVADAHSFRLLLEELAQLYEEPGSLPKLSYSYPQYLATYARLRAPARERARAYWRQRLHELPGPPELPLAAAPERIGRPRVRRFYARLDGDEWRVLADRAHEHGLTLSTVFMTAFAEALATWSAQPRFLLNLPLYDRELLHPDVAGLVGDFTNLLLVTVDATEELSFAERAERLQAEVQQTAAHADYSGVDVLRDLAHERGEVAAAPVVYTSALGLGELFGPAVRRVLGQPGWTTSQTPQVWLDFQVTEREGGLYLNWDAVDGLLAGGALEAMFDAFLAVLENLRARGADWHAAPPPLLPQEQAAVRARVNATERPESGRLLHDGFFANAAAAPERVALAWGDGGTMTYGELAERALRVAGLLQARGVRAGEPVAVTVPKGREQVAAVLGVLACGGVYVPVGVEQPLQRRRRIYGSSGARYVVTDAATASALESLPSVTPLTLETAEEAEPLDAPVSVWNEAPAYVIYTSGSTGEPKGVVVSHRAAMNTIDDLNERFRVGADDRALAVSALDFDLSVYDIFGLLAAGGAVVAVAESERRDAQRWVDLVRSHRVTLLNCVPALLDMLLTAAAPGALASTLRVVLLGGDWVGLDLPRRLAEACPGCRFVALGGTTETAIHSTVCEVAEVPAHWRSIPYGTPLGNVRCRVVDTRGRDRPDGVPGELWIGGAGVALGYRGDHERTARQFVEHDGARWYRTGDLARYWPDGTLEFLGRADFQVKIRGHRIELGEIEAALEEHPAISRAVATTSGERGRELVAVVSPATAAAGDLRSFLAERLPPHMLPTRVVAVDALPLSANGKIDRKAIRALVAAEPREQPLEPPRTDAERAVAAVWADLLGGADVGRADSFFALGGDSLVATRAVRRLRADGFSADLRALFATPVLADFAAGLSRGATLAAATIAPDPEHRHDPFPSTDVQRAYWLGRGSDFTLGGVGSHWYWEFEGEDVDVERLEEAWNRLVVRHEMLRAVFRDDGLQRILRRVPPYRIAVTESGSEAAFDALREEMAHQVLDVTRWPLFELRAVRVGRRVRIGFSFDYIVVDALSIMRIFAELGLLYADLDAQLPSVGVSFRDYVLCAGPDEATRAADEQYWLARIPELPPAPQLPLRIEPELLESPRFTRREAMLDAGQWQTVVARAREFGVTPAAVVATVYAEVLAAWSARDDLTMTFTLFDRREVHPDIYNILGDFTSLLLVEYRPSAGASWVDAMRRLQQQVWTDIERSSVSAVWVLRELARQAGSAETTVPVVFTSALGVAPEGFDLRLPFGEYVGGLSQTPQVPLDCQVLERGGGLAFNWDAVEDVFAEGVLDAMWDAYRSVLAWLAGPESDWRSAVQPLLPEAQAVVRAAVNATAGPTPDHTLHEPFFERARERPERKALVCREGTLTYGELAVGARRIAALLAARGLQPGDAVGVTLPKGPEQIGAVLGVLYAGGVYVPVGVDQPERRRARILTSAGARFVVAARGDDAFPLDAEVLRVDDASELEPLAAPARVDPDALAYVIYTSGSTGEPKGVMITHRAAANTIDDVNARFAVDDDDVVLAVSALDFDLSVYDIFGLLAAGGALVLREEEERNEARRWLELIARHGVTIWNSVPALLDMLLVSARGAELPASLRLALVSGDWVGTDLPWRLAALRPGCRLVALGGATEASIWSNAFEAREVGADWRSLPYGLPLRNQRFRVVDARGRDCPDWVPGELWIGGLGVAKGYRGDPETTAQRFVEDGGERWYRTGDLGRYRPDGTLEFLGRVDFQVKIRGHRIELGEIEAALESHAGVARAVAVTFRERASRLAAFVVPDADDLDLESVRACMAARVPAYMVPGRLLTVEALPLSANGKVDRAALARLAAGQPVDEDAPPEGPVEEELAGLWAELLGIPQVGRSTSFFALGGDSLLATQLVEALRARFGVTISLRRLFAAATVAELAAIVELERAAVESGVVEEGLV